MSIAEKYQDELFTMAKHMYARAYEAQVGDVISVSVDTFFSNSLLWRKCWYIQGWYEQRLTRRFLWWRNFPCLKKTKMVKLMYIGEEYDFYKED